MCCSLSQLGFLTFIVFSQIFGAILGILGIVIGLSRTVAKIYYDAVC